ncbi:MAG: serine/threonine-protein kinase, partial [Myxococcota bacterium]
MSEGGEGGAERKGPAAPGDVTAPASGPRASAGPARRPPSGHASTLAASDPALDPTMASSDPALEPTMASPSLGPGAKGGGLVPEHGGRYLPRDEIGRGGMGRVELVLDQHLGREVALKELLTRPGLDGSPALSAGLVTRFLREARVTGQLEHQGIVPVYELGQRSDGTPYYTMRRIRGRSLAALLGEQPDLAGRLGLLTSFRHVCEAVAYAHDRGVIHRDLKPENVMVGEFGETLVVDWGLAKVRGEPDDAGEPSARPAISGGDSQATLDGHAIGTPRYMSPEQARGDVAAIDERSDVYGLGAMLFELLSGKPPHDGKSAIDVIRQVLEHDPRPVLEVVPDAPRELAAIADRALARAPGARYADATELLAEIAAYQDGRRVDAYEYSSGELLRRFVARNKAATAAVASVLLAALVAAALVLGSWRSERRARADAER